MELLTSDNQAVSATESNQHDNVVAKEVADGTKLTVEYVGVTMRNESVQIDNGDDYARDEGNDYAKDGNNTFDYENGYENDHGNDYPNDFGNGVTNSGNNYRLSRSNRSTSVKKPSLVWSHPVHVDRSQTVSNDNNVSQPTPSSAGSFDATNNGPVGNNNNASSPSDDSNNGYNIHHVVNHIDDQTLALDTVLNFGLQIDVNDSTNPTVASLSTKDSPSTRAPSLLNTSVSSAPPKKLENDACVGLRYLASQREQYIRNRGSTFSLMVAGVAGCGKTTFINTLFGTDLSAIPDSAPSISSTDSQQYASTSTIGIKTYDLIENDFKLRFTAIDTPGFGQSIDNQHAWTPITNYIDEQFRLYAFQEEQPERSKLVDNRVHACLYFISPTNAALSPLDIASMKELCKRVNLIPVIGKADTLSGSESANFKKTIVRQLQKHQIKICHLISDQSVKKDINAMVPFSIIGSTSTHYNAENKLVRGRKYRWGVAEVENSKHCDFIALRSILMGEHMLDLVMSTELHYENYRAACLTERHQLAVAAGNQSQSPIKELQEYRIYHKVPLKQVEKELHEVDPILDLKQQKMKQSFALVVAEQEHRFKEWKRALIEKQNELNSDISRYNARLVALRDLIFILEGGTASGDEPSHRTDYSYLDSGDQQVSLQDDSIEV